MKIDEIKEELTNKYNVPSIEMNELSKKELAQKLEDFQKAETTLDGVVTQQGEDKTIDEVPTIGSKEWTPYVMALFDDSELENGMPRVDALRRVAYFLNNGPFSVVTDVVQVPRVEDNDRATVVVHLDFGGVKISGAADVYVGNTDRQFAKHPIATAETRAEGRALRKALGLTKILSAEELHNAEPDEPDGMDQRIVSSMLNGLKLMCDRQKIDLFKLAIHLGYEIQTVEDLTKQQGLAISNKLSAYSTKKEEISENVKV